MKCLNQYLTLIFLTFILEVIFVQSSSISYNNAGIDDDNNNDGIVNGGIVVVDTDANGNVDDNNNNNNEAMEDNRVVSHVLDMNASNLSSVLSNFNMTIDQVINLRNLRMSQDHPKQQQQQQQTESQQESMINDDRQLSNVDATYKPDININNHNNNNNNNNNNNVNNINGTYIKTNFEQQYKSEIRTRIESVVKNKNPNSDATDDAIIDSMAFYPVCSKNDDASWMAENTAKLYFAASMLAKLKPNSILRRADLRLFQKDPTNPTGEQRPEKNDCKTDIEEIIRVTISIMVKDDGGNSRTTSSRRSNSSRRDGKYKKKICKSFTTQRHHNGWTEIDVSQVILHWSNFYMNTSDGRSHLSDPMLMIDVEDEDRVQLKAGEFFEPSSCQAESAVPWSAYGPIWDSLGNGRMQLPHYPRIDLVIARSLPPMFSYPYYTSNVRQTYEHPSTRSYHQHQQHHHHHHRRQQPLQQQQVQQQQQPQQQQYQPTTHHTAHRYMSDNTEMHRKRHVYHKSQANNSSREESNNRK